MTTHNSKILRRLLPLALLLSAAACSPDTGPTGGPVSGPADTHCHGVAPQATSEAACHPAAGDTDGGVDEGDAGTDGGDVDAGDDEDPGSDYGVTMFGTEGDDDDCKYHVKWTASLIRKNEEVTFTVTATKLTDGSPLLGANPIAEVFLDPTHPSPSVPNGVEKGHGVYDIGPVLFDASGQWTVRFHFDEDCSDEAPDSPHGHAAFFVKVP